MSLLEAPWPFCEVTNRLFLWRHEKIYRAEVLPGVFVNLSVPKQSKLWQNRLSCVGGHERAVCEWIAANLRPDDIFYDVGAHFGFYAALVSAIQPEAEVHCFEPAPGLRQFLRGSQRLCPSGSKWIVIPKFVGNQVTADSISLDAYASASERRRRIIKADIEGAEVALIEGCKCTIDQRNTEFLIEVHPAKIAKLGSSIASLLEAFPEDYRIRVLRDFRVNQPADWVDDLTIVYGGQQTYIHASPSAS